MDIKDVNLNDQTAIKKVMDELCNKMSLDEMLALNVCLSGAIINKIKNG